MENGEIRQVLYFSMATSPMREGALSTLKDQCARNNAAVGLTGLMFYAGDYFVQCLEGPPERVEAMLTHIKRDRRHKDLTVLLDLRTPDRVFPDWSMGLEHLSSPDMLPSLTTEMGSKNPQRVAYVILDLMGRFYERNSRSIHARPSAAAEA